MNKENSAYKLGFRTKSIFRKVVESYLKNGDPVSSAKISSDLDNLLSSSSIRNVMAKLERSGLLYSPFTSSGRMPTDKGLRFFVDGLLEIGDLTKKERNDIEARCNVVGKSFLEMLNDASKELSGLLNCTSLVLAPSINQPLKHIEFVPLDSSKALVVTVDINGLVENKLIELPNGLPSSGLNEASNYVNSHLNGKTLEEAKKLIDLELEQHRSQLDYLSKKVVAAGIAIKSKKNGEEHFLVNRRDLLFGDLSADADIEKLNNLLIELEDKKNMSKIIKSTAKGTGVHVFIGADSDLFNLSGCSMIIAPLKKININKDSTKTTLGAIGVIGPTRLNYSRIIPVVDFTAKVLNKFLI